MFVPDAYAGPQTREHAYLNSSSARSGRSSDLARIHIKGLLSTTLKNMNFLRCCRKTAREYIMSPLSAESHPKSPTQLISEYPKVTNCSSGKNGSSIPTQCCSSIFDATSPTLAAEAMPQQLNAFAPAPSHRAESNCTNQPRVHVEVENLAEYGNRQFTVRKFNGSKI